MRHLALLILGLVALPTLALTNVDLYQTEVVIDQTVENSDAQARVEGMKQVIVRASGDREAASNDVVQKALKQSSQYVAQLSYGQVGDAQSLRMVFSAPHIRSLLSQAQLPIWPAARANLLVWIVEEGQADRNIVWEHSSSPVLEQIKRHAEVRGLPLTVPVGDFDDITGVAVSDLWGGFIQPIGQASQRYPVDGVLVVKAQNNSLRWTLYDQRPATIGVTRQAPLAGSNNGADAANKMINQISDYYAKKNAVVVASESSEAVKVRFTELNDAVSFFTLENQLKTLSSVAALDILKIQGNSVTFNVHLLSSQQEFEQEVGRLPDVIQLESVIDELQVITPEVTESTIDILPTETLPETAAPIESESSAQSDVLLSSDPALSVEAVPELLPTEMILLFEWQGQPYVEPAPEVETSDTVAPVDTVVSEQEVITR